MSLDCRHYQSVGPAGEVWATPKPIRRTSGHATASVGAWCSDVVEDTEVVLEGTVVHPDAPSGAWSQVWTATLSTDSPVASSGTSPLYIGCFRFLRWRLTTSATPNEGSVVHLAFDGDFSE